MAQVWLSARTPGIRPRKRSRLARAHEWQPVPNLMQVRERVSVLACRFVRGTLQVRHWCGGVPSVVVFVREVWMVCAVRERLLHHLLGRHLVAARVPEVAGRALQRPQLTQRLCLCAVEVLDGLRVDWLVQRAPEEAVAAIERRTVGPRLLPVLALDPLLSMCARVLAYDAVAVRRLHAVPPRVRHCAHRAAAQLRVLAAYWLLLWS
mmetsp:Transcript_26769/g.79508  ORF Transcript_26769/g.79508 Transcript_26769/m.79508 type:complete len:207 (+) Transcript_26769:54-674(+)